MTSKVDLVFFASFVKMASSSVAAKVCLIVIDGWGISEETKGKLESISVASGVLPNYYQLTLILFHNRFHN